jgi:hypothetical protein
MTTPERGMKRFNLVPSQLTGESLMHEDDQGEWVRYEDVVPIIKALIEAMRYVEHVDYEYGVKEIDMIKAAVDSVTGDNTDE